jgi:ferric-dicitrate binding protein FerR (iron transport regulator)
MDNKFENLLAEYLDGDADAASMTRLCEMLKDRPDLQKRFREEIRLHTLMREIGLQEIAGGQPVDFVDSGESGGRQTFRMPWRTVLSLAAGLLLVAGIGWWMLDVRRETVDDGQRAPVAAAPQVASGKGEKLVLKFDSEDTVLEMGENTLLKLPGCEVMVGSDGSGRTLKSKPQKTVEVVSGTVNVLVAKQQEGKTFVMKTGQAELTVVGTRFSAAVSGTKTRVSVSEGIVRVNPGSGGVPFSLLAGMSSDVEAGRQTTATVRRQSD